jgi:tRNA (mo5U34)-methyltransferase
VRLYQRVCLVIAHEGLSGLVKRIGERLKPARGTGISAEMAKDHYDKSVMDFALRAKQMGYQGLDKYLWYHTIDLGNGLVTPGQYDYRTQIDQFGFPENMTGMRALDIGSATGFFAFEFEKRGAEVTSVELPSIADWDMPLSEERETTIHALMREYNAASVDELSRIMMHAPFEFCAKVLDSKVKRVHSTIYDLNLDKLGGEQFDLVFVGDVLLHTFSPMKAIVTIAPLCRGTLVLAQQLSRIEGNPVMEYLDAEGDSRSWWYPNRDCLERMLKRAGFRETKLLGYRHAHHVELDFHSDRAIVHATK